MSKAVLVMDMPRKCSDCQFYYETYDENDNYVSKCEVLNDITIDGFIDKYSGCPLKPMPEKKVLSGDVADIQKMGKELIDIGYNACIDEISKGGE